MKRRINKTFVIISMIIGLVLGIVLEGLYKNNIIDFKSRIACVTLYLLIFVITLGAILLFKSLRDSAFVQRSKVMLISFVTILAFVACTALLEFLYELGGNKVKTLEATELQYVFLIDDSGSMDSNDRQNARGDAVETIIKNMAPTNRFAVYKFESGTYCITAMESANSQSYEFDKRALHSSGGTDMLTAIQDIISDVCKDEAVHTKIIALTDGAPTDDGFGNYSKTVRNCITKGASVSSIGFGSPDEDFLEELARNTGGMYVFSDNITDLINNLETIVETDTLSIGKNRDLLGYRLDATYDKFLYGFMRVAFLIILGLVWTAIKYLLIGETRFTYTAAIISAILCAVAALLCELLLIAGATDSAVRIIFCILWACTLIPEIMCEQTEITSGQLHSKKGVKTIDVPNKFGQQTKEGGSPKSFI